MNAVVVANAPGDTLNDYAAVLADAELLVAADGGARRCLEAGHPPDVVVGDLDSLDAATHAALTAAGVAIEQYPVAKNETDLELGLLEALARGARSITVLAALGGRPDMDLANLLLLAHPALHGISVQIRDQGWTIRLLTEGMLSWSCPPGCRVSLVPLALTREIRTSGLAYPLRSEALAPGPARGVSNVSSAPTVSVSIASGMLLVYSEDAPSEAAMPNAAEARAQAD